MVWRNVLIYQHNVMLSLPKHLITMPDYIVKRQDGLYNKSKRVKQSNMSYTDIQYSSNKQQLYTQLLAQVDAYVQQGDAVTTALANTSALLFNALPQINWAGFYMVAGDKLLLAPFQGKPACTAISHGKGVCGTCWATATPQLVADVHSFAGHIACDSNSNSEIVLPLIVDGTVIGVLDIDSPICSRFDNTDLTGLQSIVALLLAKIDFSNYKLL